MKPGQRLTRWWQEYVAGRFKTPGALHAAVVAEEADPARASDRFFAMPEDLRWDAPERLRAPAFMRTEAFLRLWDRADWQLVDPRLARWAAMFQEEARKRGIPLYVHCAFRTAAEQQDAVRRGVSRTHWPESAHNIGEAVDLVHGVFHWDMTRQEWALLSVLGRLVLDRLNAPLPKALKLGLTWGGDWSNPWDPAHWEISDYRQRTRPVQAGSPVRRTPRFILRHV